MADLRAPLFCRHQRLPEVLRRVRGLGTWKGEKQPKELAVGLEPQNQTGAAPSLACGLT